MHRQTYRAKLHSPLFYSSSEGTEIRTSKILSSTALTHALGYNYRNLEKRYSLTGEEATEPDYSHLKDLELFVSDMKPVEASISEKTFRTTDYRSERNITLMEGSNYKIPEYLSNTRAAWHTIRNYVGIEPGAEYEFTVWSEEPLPDTLRFRMGIKQSGEFTAEKIEETETVYLNLFMLKTVYELDEEDLSELTGPEIAFERGNDPRLQHLKNVPVEKADDLVSEL
jgi:CRISPR-associated protein Csc1